MRLSEEMRKVLKPDEKVIWWGKPDTVALVAKSLPAVLFGIFLIIAGYLILSWELQEGVLEYHMKQSQKYGVKHSDLEIVVILFLFPMALGALLVAIMPLYYYYISRVSEFVITNRRIISRSGLDYKSSEFDKVLSVNVTYTLLEKMRGVGTVETSLSEISGSGFAHNIFFAIKNPHKVQKMIKKRVPHRNLAKMYRQR